MNDTDAILAGIGPDERARWVVYLAPEPCEAGSTLPGGAGSIARATTIVAFVDEQPGANWMHACHYELFEPETGRRERVAADRPPAFPGLPPGWRVIARPPGVADWMLLPIAVSE